MLRNQTEAWFTDRTTFYHVSRQKKRNVEILRLNLYEEKVFRTLQNFRVACGHFGGCVAHVTQKLCELFLVNLYGKWSS